MENSFLSTVNDAAILNLYLYLVNNFLPQDGESFYDIILKLYYNYKRNVPNSWTDAAKRRLDTILYYLDENKRLASGKLISQICSESGLCACAFALPDSSVHVAFRGTGNGEWIDNGDGLSGIPSDGDFATEQQAEALNWFEQLLTYNNLNTKDIILSGHSKGGNKAQFISLFHDVSSCVSIDGQGFSPEAISDFKRKLGKLFDIRSRRIFNFSAENDYINVLGSSIVPAENRYYLKSSGGFHFLEAILKSDGTLMEFTDKGKLSKYVERISDELMSLPPAMRKYATLGVMNVFQKYIADAPNITSKEVSLEETLAGLGVATFSVLKSFIKNN